MPMQALCDDGLNQEVRLTLALLYAFADDHGESEMTPSRLQPARMLHRNSIRIHFGKLEKAGYIIQRCRTPKGQSVSRERLAGYALTVDRDGGKWSAASRKAVGKGWDRKERWV